MREGSATSVRFAAEDGAAPIAEALRRALPAANFGLVPIPVRERGLVASRGATDFGAYFLYFSFFLIVSAFVLLALLYRLGVERRVGEIGLLLASGWPPRAIFRGLLLEIGGVALAGAAGGAAAGVLHASLMLGLLSGLLRGAVSGTLSEAASGSQSALGLFVSAGSITAGLAGGLAMAAFAAFWTSRRLVHRPSARAARRESRGREPSRAPGAGFPAGRGRPRPPRGGAPRPERGGRDPRRRRVLRSRGGASRGRSLRHLDPIVRAARHRDAPVRGALPDRCAPSGAAGARLSRRCLPAGAEPRGDGARRVRGLHAGRGGVVPEAGRFGAAAARRRRIRHGDRDRLRGSLGSREPGGPGGTRPPGGPRRVPGLAAPPRRGRGRELPEPLPARPAPRSRNPRGDGPREPLSLRRPPGRNPSGAAEPLAPPLASALPGRPAPGDRGPELDDLCDAVAGRGSARLPPGTRRRRGGAAPRGNTLGQPLPGRTGDGRSRPPRPSLGRRRLPRVPDGAGSPAPGWAPGRALGRSLGRAFGRGSRAGPRAGFRAAPRQRRPPSPRTAPRKRRPPSPRTGSRKRRPPSPRTPAKRSSSPRRGRRVCWTGRSPTTARSRPRRGCGSTSSTAWRTPTSRPSRPSAGSDSSSARSASARCSSETPTSAAANGRSSRPSGYRPRDFTALGFWENALLLVAGLAAGTGAALLAIFPALGQRGFGASLGLLALLLAGVLGLGLAAGSLAARAAANRPILASLRSG